MDITVSYKMLQFVMLLIFAYQISGFGKRTFMKPIVSEKYTRLLKMSYLIPVFSYGYILVTLENVYVTDILGLILSVVGTVYVFRARMDLSRVHTWAGYYKHKTQLVTQGIYAYIRHPIYTGVYFYIFGSFVIIIPHLLFGGLSNSIPPLPSMVQMAAIASLVYIMGFLAMVASRESTILTTMFGDEYIKYKKQTHAFLPLRKFKDSN